MPPRKPPVFDEQGEPVGRRGPNFEKRAKLLLMSGGSNTTPATTAGTNQIVPFGVSQGDASGRMMVPFLGGNALGLSEKERELHRAQDLGQLIQKQRQRRVRINKKECDKLVEEGKAALHRLGTKYNAMMRYNNRIIYSPARLTIEDAELDVNAFNEARVSGTVEELMLSWGKQGQLLPRGIYWNGQRKAFLSMMYGDDGRKYEGPARKTVQEAMEDRLRMVKIRQTKGWDALEKLCQDMKPPRRMKKGPDPSNPLPVGIHFDEKKNKYVAQVTLPRRKNARGPPRDTMEEAVADRDRLRAAGKRGGIDQVRLERRLIHLELQGILKPGDPISSSLLAEDAPLRTALAASSGVDPQMSQIIAFDPSQPGMHFPSDAPLPKRRGRGRPPVNAPDPYKQQMAVVMAAHRQANLATIPSTLMSAIVSGMAENLNQGQGFDIKLTDVNYAGENELMGILKHHADSYSPSKRNTDRENSQNQQPPPSYRDPAWANAQMDYHTAMVAQHLAAGASMTVGLAQETGEQPAQAYRESEDQEGEMDTRLQVPQRRRSRSRSRTRSGQVERL